MVRRIGRDRRLWLASVFGAIALAIVGVGCGSDDDGGSSASAQAGGAEQAAGGDRKQQLEADYEKFVDAIYDDRWKEACSGYSDAYVKVYPKQVQSDVPCVGTMKGEFTNVDVQPRPWVAKVEFKSDTRAVGYTKTRDDSPGNPLKFVKENGTWKLDGPATQN